MEYVLFCVSVAILKLVARLHVYTILREEGNFSAEAMVFFYWSKFHLIVSLRKVPMNLMLYSPLLNINRIVSVPKIIFLRTCFCVLVWGKLTLDFDLNDTLHDKLL